MSQQGGKLEHQPTAEGSNRRVDRLNKHVFAMELTQQMDIVSRARDGVGILGVWPAGSWQCVVFAHLFKAGGIQENPPNFNNLS